MPAGGRGPGSRETVHTAPLNSQLQEGTPEARQGRTRVRGPHSSHKTEEGTTTEKGHGTTQTGKTARKQNNTNQTTPLLKRPTYSFFLSAFSVLRINGMRSLP